MIKKNIRIHTTSEIYIYCSHCLISRISLQYRGVQDVRKYRIILIVQFGQILRCHSPGNPLCIDRGRSQTECCTGSIWGYTSQSHCQAEHRGKNSVTKGMSNMYLSLTQDSLF